MNTTNLRLINEYRVNERYPLWHPYASINKGFEDSINIEQGDRIFLFDNNGKKYIDASSGLWNVTLGYSNERIQNAIINQLKKIPYCSLFEHTNMLALQATSKIRNLLPSYLQKIFLTCSGSESVELSIKIMRMYWTIIGKSKKKEVLSLSGAYHGTSYASLTASGLERPYWSDISPMIQGMKIVNCVDSSEYGANDCNGVWVDELCNYIMNFHERIAGIIVEPILASDSVRIIEKNILQRIDLVCKQHNVLITMDEVATGFYRTGKAFCFSDLNIKPDLVCMGKGINSGYIPMGAVAVCEKLVAEFARDNIFILHGSTQDGNLLACAACVATLDQYSELNIEKNVQDQSEYIKNELYKRLNGHPNIKCVRIAGLMIEIELSSGLNKDGYLGVHSINKLHQKMLDKGLIVYKSERGLTILPMLIVSRSDVDSILEIMSNVFNDFFFE